MKNKSDNKKFVPIIAAGITLLAGLALLVIYSISQKSAFGSFKTEAPTIRAAGFEILAAGQVGAQDTATLHFQTGGKLTYLPVHEGDHVYQGQTIAQIDTYALQKELQLAANVYQQSKNNTDQENENNNAGIAAGQLRTSLDTTNKNGYNGTTEAQVITDTVARIVDNDAISQNSAQLGVDLANYAVSLATLTSPFSGIVTHEDVTTSNVNITPVTSFIVEDPSTTVFQAYVSENDIDFVAVGASAKINLGSNSTKTYSGTVIKVYPEKTTMSDGSKVYQVDIQSDQVKQNGKLDQQGSTIIESNVKNPVALIPTWLILNDQYVWVLDNEKPTLRKVTTGKTHGNNTEIEGLESNDRIILNPSAIVAKNYNLF